jgi:hypothetical protein
MAFTQNVEKPERRRATGKLILEAITDLHNSEQIVTREVLVQVTGFKMPIVDWHVNQLVDDEKIRRVKAGVFVPVGVRRPARPISRSIVPDDGTSVLEIGETVVVLTPKEARMMGEIFGGVAMQYASIQLSHEVGVANAHNDVLLREANRRIEHMEKEIYRLMGAGK